MSTPTAETHPAAPARVRRRRSTPSVAPSVAPTVAPVLALALVAALVSALALTLAAPLMAAPFGDDRPEVDALLATLGERFEVLPLSESYALRPRPGAELPGAGEFSVIEVRRESVLVDGEPASRATLRRLLGDDEAERVDELARLGRAASPGDLEERERAVDELESELRQQVEELERLRRERRAEERRIEVEERRIEVEEQREVRTDTHISFGSSRTVEENEVARDVVLMGGSLDVRGKVEGDAVVIGGSIEIQGEVSGDAVAVGGSVSLGPEARVYGEVSSIGGKVYRDPGAEVYGSVTEVATGPWEGFGDVDWGWPWWHGGGGHGGWLGFALVDLIELLVNTVFLLVLTFLVVLLARRLAEGVADRAEREPWKAGLVGLMVQILFFPVLVVVCIVLLISIVGIPLALLLVPLSLLLALVVLWLGYAGVALWAGQRLLERFNYQHLGPYAAVAVGVGLIQVWSIFGEALAVIGGPIKVVAFLLIVGGFLLKYVAWTVGLGAVLLHRFSPLPATADSWAPPPPPPPSGFTAAETETIETEVLRDDDLALGEPSDPLAPEPLTPEPSDPGLDLGDEPPRRSDRGEGSQ